MRPRRDAMRPWSPALRGLGLPLGRRDDLDRLARVDFGRRDDGREPVMPLLERCDFRFGDLIDAWASVFRRTSSALTRLWVPVTPISRPRVKGRAEFFWRRQPPIASFLFLPSAAGLKSRPFLHDWLRTHAIAPDTHEDQALVEPCGFPSPWRLGRPRRTLVPRRVQEICQFPWLSASQLQSPAGWRRGRSASHCRWRRRSGVQFSSAGCNPSHRTWLTGPPSVLQAKQRVTSNGRPSFRMW